MPRIRVLYLALACAAVAACADSNDPTPESFRANLTPAAEVPPVTNAPGASGEAFFTLRAGAIDFIIEVAGLTGAATGAHIHGPALPGANAGILVGFSPLASATTGRLAAGSFTAPTATGVSMDSLLVLLRNGRAYVNVHTSLNPGGEIRGQIARQ